VTSKPIESVVSIAIIENEKIFLAFFSQTIKKNRKHEKDFLLWKFIRLERKKIIKVYFTKREERKRKKYNTRFKDKQKIKMLNLLFFLPYFNLTFISLFSILARYPLTKKKKESTETSWHFIIIFFIFKTFCCHPSPSSARYK